MSDLTKKRCLPCEGGIPAISENEIDILLANIPNWRYESEGSYIKRSFTFSNFHETMAFVNALAWIAHQENHHPDLEVGYHYCHVRYNTHAVGGLTENDFICAAKVDALINP